jgi:hypothetical protein
MKLLRLAATAFIVLSLSAHGESQGIPEAGISESAISLSNDAYHFLYWLGTTQPGSYTEWWYFNVYDSSNNVQAIFSYLVTNPASLPGGVSPLGISDMAVVAYTGGGIVTESDLYLTHVFSAATQLQLSTRIPTRSKAPRGTAGFCGILLTAAQRRHGTQRYGSMWLPSHGN